MKTKIKAIALALALALGFGVLGAAAGAADVKSLRPTEANQPDAPPAIFKVVEGAKHDRAYRQQPPMVPHSIDKYETDIKVNQCLRCHEWPFSDQEKAPKISDMHYIDRNGIRQDTVNGNRYFCKQCHVPQVDAKPLVDNKFQPATLNTNLR
ncbi:nitrate reductase cytochrome c-type subunit [Magnetospirillum sp. SS-4]|uniref:nitrate reductase cytochrome c-type subunit n=1 Tax=Magnetospirillum sp. SS-4 TaxID=2681465 RepID=UPI0013828833|nr:nitrate reductase cytochrome c-type subunit [Magnetospirillum sp. SS-4]CAA7621692.1 Periplasmic nitrate reductase, electron transfer subunit [Magnetospirillum sp. SS-4]